ncbi:MAG: hypothetical protein IJW22_04975 [Clostridia bacterium]|nr:hypothetical protein [Clostridia bacterium]
MKEKQASNEKRLEHMLAFRERRIAALEEELQGYRERTALCDALMAYVLFCGAKGEAERTLPIGREALCDFLSHWESAVERSEEGYLIHFTKRQEAEHGAPCAAE